MHSLKIASEFINSFSGPHAFAAFHDQDKNHPQIRKGEHEKIEDAFEKLCALNDDGYGIYFHVNQTNGSGTKLEDFTKVRAVWVDYDHEKAKFQIDDPHKEGLFPIKPNIIVSTSPGNYHFYWLTETDKFKEHFLVERALIAFGNDKRCVNLDRVLRIPGFNHMKREPVAVTFEKIHDKIYQWSEITSAFGFDYDEEEEEREKSGASKPTELTLSEIRSLAADGHIHGPTIYPSIGFLNMLKNVAVQGPEALKKIHRNPAFKLYVEMLDDALSGPSHIPGHAKRTINADLCKIIDEIEVESGEEEILELDRDKIKLAHDVDMTYPDSDFGQLAKEFGEMAQENDQTIGVLSALTCGSIAYGRVVMTDNDLGCNLQTCLLAPAAFGKSSVNRNVDRFLKTALQAGWENIKHSDYSGPKDFLEALAKYPNMFILVSEAGQAFSSIQGEKFQVMKLYLDTYNFAGFDNGDYRLSTTAKFKGMENKFISPSVTMFYDSAQTPWFDAMRSGKTISSGLLSRMIMAIGIPKKPNVNRIPRREFTPQTLEKIKRMGKIMSISNAIKPTKKPFIFERKASDYATEIMQFTREEAYKCATDGDDQKADFLARSHTNIFKAAAIADFYSSDMELEKSGTLSKKHLDWAFKEIFQRNMSTFETIRNEIHSGTIDEIAIRIAATEMFHYIVGNKTHRDVKINEKMKEGLVITKRSIELILGKKKEIRALQKRPNEARGFEVIIEYMLGQGYIRKLTGLEADSYKTMHSKWDSQYYKMENKLLNVLKREFNL